MDIDTLLSRGEIVAETGCIEWQGCVQANGYGRIRFAGKTRYVHRVACELAHGPIPEGFDVCHRCDNRKCLNPEHLFVGTRNDNMQDCVSKGRISRGDAHSKTISNKGKKLTGEEARIIRMAANEGMKTRTLATVFMVDISLIRMIKNNLIWQEA